MVFGCCFLLHIPNMVLDCLINKNHRIKADVSAEYNAFKTAFGIVDSGEEETEVTISQSGSVLTIIGVPEIASVVQTGSVLTMT